MLHETTQRRVCRLVFLLGCILPSLGCVWWCYRHDPESELTIQLEAILGCHVEVDKVTTPRPGISRCEEVRLLEPETHHTLADLQQVEIRENSSIHAQKVIVPSSGLSGLAKELEELLRVDSHPAFSLTARQLVIGENETSLTSSDVSVELTFDPTTTEQSFRLTSNSANLTLRRNRMVEPPATHGELTTVGDPIPCPLLASIDNAWNRAGPRSTFRGKVEWVSSREANREECRGEISGEIQHADLASAIGLANESELTATATLHIDELKWQAGQLTSLTCGVETTSGRIGRYFVWSLYEGLKLQVGAELSKEWSTLNNDEKIDFDRLAFRCTLDETGISLSGPPALGILVRDGQPLLFGPSSNPLQHTGLLQALSLNNLETSEAAAISRLLPWPTAANLTARKSQDVR